MSDTKKHFLFIRNNDIDECCWRNNFLRLGTLPPTGKARLKQALRNFTLYLQSTNPPTGMGTALSAALTKRPEWGMRTPNDHHSAGLNEG